MSLTRNHHRCNFCFVAGHEFFIFLSLWDERRRDMHSTFQIAPFVFMMSWLCHIAKHIGGTWSKQSYLPFVCSRLFYRIINALLRRFKARGERREPAWTCNIYKNNQTMKRDAFRAMENQESKDKSLTSLLNSLGQASKHQAMTTFIHPFIHVTCPCWKVINRK